MAVAPASVLEAKKVIRRAFQYQVEGKGFSFVEVLSSCPTNWGLAPNEALGWLRENMIPYYPLGVYKDKSADVIVEAAAKKEVQS